MTNRFLDKGNAGNASVSVIIATLCLTVGTFFIGGLPLSLVYQAGVARSSMAFFLSAFVPFILGWMSLAVCTIALLKRPVTSLLTSTPRLRWGKLTAMFAFTLLFLAGTDIVLSYLYPEQYHITEDFSRFFIFLVPALLLFPLQASFEEVFVRGFLMQLFGRRRYMAIPALVLTSLIFGLIHAGNAELDKFGAVQMIAYYSLTGLMLGILTLLSEGLELAIGFHVANNLYASMGVGVEGSSLETPSLFFRVIEPEAHILWETIPGLLLFLLLTMFIFRLFDWKRIIG